MITCAECLERNFLDDPRVPVGRYKQSGCDYYCSKPAYERELEKRLERAESYKDSERAMIGPQEVHRDEIDQLKARVLYLQNKINEEHDKKKRPKRYKEYRDA